MNPAPTSPGAVQPTRRKVVQEAILRLNTDLLTVPASGLGSSERQLARFRMTLAELGPVFSQFGRYLGARHDLFRPEVCRTFLETGAVALPAADELAGAHALDFPEATSHWLSKLQPEADRSDHLTHYYRWPGQPRLSLRLLNPAFVQLWQDDQHLLIRLDATAGRLWPRTPLKEVVTHFRATTEQLLDLKALAGSYTRLAAPAGDRDGSASEQFGLPEVAEEFCGPGILGVFEPAPSASGPTSRAAFERIPGAGPSDSARIGLARDLSLRWIRQTLRGSWFPVVITAENLGETSTGAPAILGGLLAALDHEAQDFLYRYLCAVAANQPDVAADILVNRLPPSRRAKGPEEVRDLFRQIVPFRDGQINRSGDHELVAEHVLAQLRVIREAGYPLKPELLAFQESFATLARTVHELSPRRDTFKDALYEFRWTDSISNLRKLFTLGTAVSQGQAWLNLMMEIPEKMNLAAQGHGIAQTTPLPASRKSAARPGPATVLAAHAFVLLLLAWLVHSVLVHRADLTWVVILLVSSILATSISMIRALLTRN